MYQNGISKSVSTCDMYYVFERIFLRMQSKSFHKWKLLMMQERLIEVFETEGGLRSNEEIYIHNTLLKATRNIFRFYSRKVTKAFYRWRFSLENYKSVKVHKEMERSLKQTK